MNQFLQDRTFEIDIVKKNRQQLRGLVNKPTYDLDRSLKLKDTSKETLL